MRNWKVGDKIRFIGIYIHSVPYYEIVDIEDDRENPNQYVMRLLGWPYGNIIYWKSINLTEETVVSVSDEEFFQITLES